MRAVEPGGGAARVPRPGGAGGRARPVGRRHLAQASVYYHFAKFLFVHDLTQLREAHHRAVRCLTDALPFLTPPGERVEIPFDGATLAGVLRRPAGPGPRRSSS